MSIELSPRELAVIRALATIKKHLSEMATELDTVLQPFLEQPFKPSQQPPPPPSETLNMKTLDALPWRDKEGGSGAWIFADVNEVSKQLWVMLEKSQDGKTVLGEYNYRASKGSTRNFIWRYHQTK